MSHLELIFCVFGMALVSGIPRILPMTLLADKKIPVFFLRWLSFVPAAILAALVAPDILIRDGLLDISVNNLFLLAAIPTLIVGILSRSLFLTLALGMFFLAMLRYFGL